MEFKHLNFLESALKSRSALFQDPQTDMFRLFNGRADGIPGLVIEQFGSLIIFQIFDGGCQLGDEELRLIGQWIMKERKAISVYKKRFISDRSAQVATQEYYSEYPFVGLPAEKEKFCKEKGVFLEIRPFSGYSTGLFLDQRNNREWIASLSSGKEVLNLFSYTCAFSVASATKGGKTTSVDLSRKYLEWGKKNFQQNQIGLEGHQFIAQDTFVFLKQATKRQKKFDVVIVDPPSFSRTKDGKVFSLKKDFPSLLEATLSVIASPGVLFFSCNLSDWNSEMLTNKVKAVIGETDQWKMASGPAVPADFVRSSKGLSQFVLFKQS